MNTDKDFEELINNIVARANIVDIIGSYIDLQKKGKNYWGICPFHDDSNPSLSVTPEKRIFNCFVCHTGGNVIRFVQLYEKIPFMEAARKVAKMSGYYDPRLEQHDTKPRVVDDKKDTMLKCLKDLTTYYQYSLNTTEGKEGLDYLEGRALTQDIRKKFLIGYSPKDGKATCKFLQGKGYSIKQIEDIGIAYIEGTELSDFNRGRVTFPICNADGNVVGFSARILGKSDTDAKYKNTPDTYVFNKSKILYNYHRAKDIARQKQYIYVCEGFMDVIALSKIGIDNAVALMGTAMTADHIAMLRILNCEIRMCLDNDNAGQEATVRAIKQLEAAGLKYRIVNKEGVKFKDSDEILENLGKDALENYLNNLISRMDFLLSYFQGNGQLKTVEHKKALIKEFLPILISLKSQLELDSYVRRLAGATGFEQESIKDLINRAKLAASNDEPDTFMQDFHPERKALLRLEIAERELLYQMLLNKSAVAFYEQNNILFYDDVYRQIANFIIDYAKSHDDLDTSGFLTSLELSGVDGLDSIVNECTQLYCEKNHPTICSDELLQNLLNSINEEKEKIYKKDILEQALDGKDPLEKARILADYNRRESKNRK